MVRIDLKQEIDSFRETLEFHSPNSLVEEFLEESCVVVAAGAEEMFDPSPHGLHTIGCHVLALPGALLSFVNNAMSVEVLETIVTSPEVSPHFGTWLNCF